MSITRLILIRGTSCGTDDDCNLYPDPNGDVLTYADHEREMQEAYRLIEGLRDTHEETCKCVDCNKALAWLNDPAHKEYAPREANRG